MSPRILFSNPHLGPSQALDSGTFGFLVSVPWIHIPVFPLDILPSRMCPFLVFCFFSSILSLSLLSALPCIYFLVRGIVLMSGCDRAGYHGIRHPWVNSDR